MGRHASSTRAISAPEPLPAGPRVVVRVSALLGALLVAAATFAQQTETESATSLCEKALLGFRAEPVRFDESGTSMRPSGEAILDRVVELASTCRESLIEITGHADSSGDEKWNQLLSLQRAQAVADEIAARGIAPERLIVKGAGSSKPVADNALRYGRSLNRRIEIVMRPSPAVDVSQSQDLPGSSNQPVRSRTAMSHSVEPVACRALRNPVRAG